MGPSRVIAPVLMLLLSLGLLQSCNSSGHDAQAGNQPSTTRRSAPSTTSPAEAERGAVEAWRIVWTGLTRSSETEAWPSPEAQEAARDVAEPMAIDKFPALAQGRRATLFPVPKLQIDGSYAIEDCVILRPSPTLHSTLKFTGRVENRDNRWIVTEVEQHGLDPCAPKSMVQDAIDGYEAYWEARLEFWSPPDPDHHSIGQTTTGKRQERLASVLADHQARGLHLQGRPTTHPEAIEVRSPTEMVLLDCQEVDPQTGIYDASGGRTGEIDPVVPGQRDLLSAVMRLEDDAWKVEDLQGQVHAACQFPPTSEGLPVVG